MSMPGSASITESAVLDVLRTIKDPDLGKDIVSLGLIRDLHIHDADVSFTLAFTTQPPATKVALHSGASKAVSQIPGVSRVQVKMGSAAAAARPAQPPGPAAGAEFIPDVKHTIAVSSGKGGVGKSTIAVNLALALRQTGAQVGLVDVDVYGPDVPLMMGARGRPGMFDNKIIPVEAHGIKIMSIGLLVAEREALVWRGPMIHSAVQQFLRDVMWGALEYLVFDMPPGTGDAQLSLSQVVPLTGVVMVTTPQDVALLGQIPLEMETRKGGDAGIPIVVGQPDSAQAKAFREVAAAVRARVDAVSGLKLPTIGERPLPVKPVYLPI